jgi:RNA polymerase Rpb2, domain 4
MYMAISQHLVYCYYTGNILGVTLDSRRLVEMFRKVRRAGLISEFVSISPSHKHRLIHIACDGGRVCRYSLVDKVDTCLEIVILIGRVYYF